MNINRDYLIINDVKKSNIKLDNGSMFFYITDKNTQNIFVNLVINISNNDLIQKYANIENAEDYTLTMNIVKPSNTYKVVEGKLHDKEKAIFEFNLNEDCCDEIGPYRCELLTKCNINDHEEITTSNKLTYKVKSSVLNDLDDIVEAPEYPLVIQLFDKLSDIEQYEEDRRANELARQLAEEQRQTKHNELVTDMTNSIQAMDNKVVDVENRMSAKEEAVDTLIIDAKTDIAEYKVAKDQEIDDYKTAKDTEINNAITAQDTKIDTAISEQNNRIDVVENNVAAQNGRLDALENKDTLHESRLEVIEVKDTEQDSRLDIAENRLANIGNDITNTMQPIIDGHTARLDAIEAIDVAQNTRLDAIEVKNQQQDDRLLDIEKVNNRQDIDIKCLYGASQTIDVAKEGNSIYLQNSNNGFTIVDEIKGNTLVNCNKEPDKELVLNGNINTRGDNAVTITEGVDGGLVDVALEGNTLVNVSKTKDSTAITKAYTVENSGNHIALQGDVDGNCRPVITGKTLWIDNDTEEILTAFDGTKNLRLQSSFEDNLVTQEMVDNGEEVADNLGKYRVDYKSTREDGTVGNTKTLYLNSPLLEGDTIEEKDGAIYHVHRSELVPYTEGNESSLITDKVNTVHQLETPTYELIEQSNLVIPSYANGHLDFNTVIPVEKVEFKPFSEELTYLYANTQYTLQFISDKAITVDITLGGTQLLAQSIVAGLNRISITTPATLVDNRLVISGAGANISEVVVTDTDREFGYFEGMKSVGECEELEVRSNNKNLIDPSKVVKNKKIDSQTGEVLDESSSCALVDYVPIKPNIPLIYSVTKVGTENNPIKGTRFHFYDINKKHIYSCWISATGELPSSVLNKKTPNNAHYLRISYGINDGWGTSYESILTGQLEYGTTKTGYIPHQSNTQQLTHEPLRAVGDVKDRYVLVDGKWYIERNCSEVVLDGSENWIRSGSDSNFDLFYTNTITNLLVNSKCISDKYKSSYKTTDKVNVILCGNSWKLQILKPKETTLTQFKSDLQTNPLTVIYQSKTQTYEPIDYNPFTAYSEVTHISNNSTIPCNMTIKNTGYNCLLKPSTTYTVSSNLGLNTVTTPSTLTEDCLRFYDTDTSTITTMNNVTILEGDYTTDKPIPSHFAGIESAFEQEYDEAVGKYRVTARVIGKNLLNINEDLNIIDTVTIPSHEIIGDKVNITNIRYKGWVHIFKMLVDPNKTYSVSYKCESTSNSHRVFTSLNGNRVDDYRKNGSDLITITGITGVDTIYIQYNTNTEGTATFSNIQLEEGSTATEYEPYKENNITFYINEPLRGIGDIKDKVYVKDVKVVVERNCGQREYQDGDFGTYLTDKVNTVYQLAEPTYEEVEYNDIKLSIESFKNSTLFYNSNIPVTSTIKYTYSVPLVDTVAQTASISDEQDNMIIDLATQVAVMEMMLM